MSSNDPAAAVPLAALSIEGAGLPLASALAAMAGVSAHLPSDLSAGGEILLQRDGSVAGAIRLATAGSDLHLRVAMAADGALLGSTLRGRLGADDAVTLGIFPSPLRPRAPAALDCDGQLGGTALCPTIAGRVSCARVVLEVSADPAHLTLLLEEVSALLDVGPDAITWHRFTGAFAGGTFASSGRFGFAADGGLGATLGFSSLRVERLPTQAEGDSRLATILHGRASGEIRFDRSAFPGSALSAHGHVAVAEPRYLFTRAFAAELGRFGLPAVRTRGKGPLTAKIAFDGDSIHIGSIAASLQGIAAAGDLAVRLDGRLAGRLSLQVADSYLLQSPLLVLPAAVAGRVTIPVDLSGTVSAPEISTDALAVLEGLLSDNRVADTVKSVLDGVFSAAAGRRRRRDIE